MEDCKPHLPSKPLLESEIQSLYKVLDRIMQKADNSKRQDRADALLGPLNKLRSAALSFHDAVIAQRHIELKNQTWSFKGYLIKKFNAGDFRIYDQNLNCLTSTHSLIAARAQIIDWTKDKTTEV